MPMFLMRRYPDNIAGMNLLDGAAFALYPSTAGRDKQRLSEGVCVPCSPGAGLKRHAGPGNECRVRRGKERVDATAPVNQSDGPFTDGCDPTLLISILFSFI